jgi:hypothetical protein
MRRTASSAAAPRARMATPTSRRKRAEAERWEGEDEAPEDHVGAAERPFGVRPTRVEPARQVQRSGDHEIDARGKDDRDQVGATHADEPRDHRHYGEDDREDPAGGVAVEPGDGVEEAGDDQKDAEQRRELGEVQVAGERDDPEGEAGGGKQRPQPPCARGRAEEFVESHVGLH